MSKFVVGYINFFDNDLIIEIIEAEDWLKALHKHSQMIHTPWEDYFADCTIGRAKEKAFDADMMFDVIEIK